MTNLFYRAGRFSSYQQALVKAGGIEMTFPKGQDIFSFLEKNELCLEVEDGFLDMYVLTPEAEAYELVSFTKGSFLPAGFRSSDPLLSSCCMLVPASKSLRGIILPLRNLERVRLPAAETVSQLILQTTQELFCISVLNTALFHTGSGLTRVCNYLWHYDTIRLREEVTPPIVQDRIMRKTLLSKSQLTRVLIKLRQQGIITTGYRSIVIRDRERMRQYVSSALQEMK